MCWNLSWASPAANTSPIKSTFSTTTLPERSLCLSTSINESAPFSSWFALYVGSARFSANWILLCLALFLPFSVQLPTVPRSHLRFAATTHPNPNFSFLAANQAPTTFALLFWLALFQKSFSVVLYAWVHRPWRNGTFWPKMRTHQTLDSICKNFSWWHTQTSLELPPWTLAQLLLPSVFSQQPGWLGWAHKN